MGLVLIVIGCVIFVATVNYLKSKDARRHENAVIGEEQKDLGWIPLVLAIAGGLAIPVFVVLFL